MFAVLKPALNHADERYKALFEIFLFAWVEGTLRRLFDAHGRKIIAPDYIRDFTNWKQPQQITVNRTFATFRVGFERFLRISVYDISCKLSHENHSRVRVFIKILVIKNRVNDRRWGGTLSLSRSRFFFFFKTDLHRSEAVQSPAIAVKNIFQRSVQSLDTRQDSSR